MPRMRSTYMEPGPHAREEIIGCVKKGIYCENFTNGQVNIGAGDFTFYVKNGYLIEDGKLTRPVKDMNIIGNGPKVLEQMDMVATTWSSTRAAGPAARTARACRSRRASPPSASRPSPLAGRRSRARSHR
ncbi:MAG: metallopeptidase TldD-related protein [Anaeromyxobacter sp.]